jgi:hypothetical protein
MSDARSLVLTALGALAIAAAASRSGVGSSAKPPFTARFVYDEFRGPLDLLVRILEEAASRGIPAELALPAPLWKDERSRLFQVFYDFVKSGQQSFVVGPKLQGLFAATSLEKLPLDVLEMPYHCFYVALPDSGLRIWDPQIGWREMSGAFVRQMPENPKFYQIFVWGLGPPNLGQQTVETSVDSYVFLDLDEVAEHGDIETYLDRKGWEAMEKRGYWKDPRWAMHYPEVSESLRDVLRIVLNMVVYLNAGSPDASDWPGAQDPHEYEKLVQKIRLIQSSNLRERAKKREVERLERKLAHTSHASVVWLGKGVEESSRTRATAANRIRQWVRGHWRVPARKHGPRRIMWIMPYERNKDAPERITKRTYLLPGE